MPTVNDSIASSISPNSISAFPFPTQAKPFSSSNGIAFAKSYLAFSYNPSLWYIFPRYIKAS